MLIRIAPDMFRDDRYGCVTIQEVFQELFRTQKFKTRYPWRESYKSKIKTLGTSRVKQGDYELCLQAVENLISASKINKRTGHFFNLSSVDQKIAACSIVHDFTLTTVDDDLADFIRQEFSGSSISPLGIINDWLEKGLV
jgi:mRNA-degrading endonuclease RelE of RelBE toxin-antitoxin system